MSWIELLLLAVGLSMDAFAISICLGLSEGKVRLKRALAVGLFFGGFQALMPLLGYLLGSVFQEQIEKYDHWVAFILLGYIGLHMLKESWDSRKDPENTVKRDGGSIRKLLVLSLATSVDALAVGVTFAFLRVDVFTAAGVIGVITFALSACGVALGVFLGSRLKTWAEAAGGLVLIGIGLKILLEHTVFLF